MASKTNIKNDYSYIINAANYAGDTESWFRYLGKHINKDVCTDSLECILDDLGLSIFQKRTLISAFTKGSFLNRWLYSRYAHLPLNVMEEYKRHRKLAIENKVLKYDLSNLKAYVASPLYVLGMKLNSILFGSLISFMTDCDDAVSLIRNNAAWDIQEVFAQLKMYRFMVTPEDLFTIFYVALGYEWYNKILQDFGPTAMQDFCQDGKFI